MGIVWARARSVLISMEFRQVNFSALKNNNRHFTHDGCFCVLLHTALNLTEWCQIAMCDFSMDNKLSYQIFFSSVSRQSCVLEGESHPHDHWVLHLQNIAFLDQSPPLCDHRASSSSLSTPSASTKHWEKGSLALCSRLFGPRKMEARYRNPKEMSDPD